MVMHKKNKTKKQKQKTKKKTRQKRGWVTFRVYLLTFDAEQVEF